MKFSSVKASLLSLVSVNEMFTISAKLLVEEPPPLTGIRRSHKPKVILAMDVDYPPYTAIGEDFSLSGFSPDFAKGLEEICAIDIEVVQASWPECWGSDKIGPGLLNANYHGCAAYTHTKGVRNRYLEFTKPILAMNKAAGILTRLENGEPVVSGSSNLSGVTVGDVTGWAPTSDVLAASTNQCTDQKFSNFTIMKSSTEKPNDDTLTMLLDGRVDAVWIYADQADKYSSACADNPNQDGWDCSLWSKFGIEFAYIQTGIYDYMQAGTTFATSRKGSGLAKTLDPCISKFLKKKKYKDLCYKYGMENDCIQNQYFNITTNEVPHYSKPTRELNTTCADGYCPCNVAKPSAMPAGTPPSGSPSAALSGSPSAALSGSPTAKLSGSPTAKLSGSPTAKVTGSPTAKVTGSPTAKVTGSPTAKLSGSPTYLPTASSSGSPTYLPTASSSGSPTAALSGSPSAALSHSPSAALSGSPTASPSGSPTASPSGSPTASSSGSPTANPPTTAPVTPPTSAPVNPPTTAPVTPPTSAPVTPPTTAPVTPPTSAPVTTTAPVTTFSPTASSSGSPTATMLPFSYFD